MGLDIYHNEKIENKKAWYSREIVNLAQVYLAIDINMFKIITAELSSLHMTNGVSTTQFIQTDSPKNSRDIR